MEVSEHQQPEADWNRHPVSEWTPWLLDDCRRIGGSGFRPDLNVWATLAHHAPVLLTWVALGRAVLDVADLAPADRERVILWTASRCGGRYPFARHVPLARAAGVTCDEIQRISSQPTQHRPSVTHGVSVRPLIGFYAMASFVLESLRTPPDSDVASHWPSWSRTDGGRTIGPDLASGLDWTDESGTARARLVTALVESRELTVPEWNGIVLAARRKFGRSGPTSVLLPGPADTDAAAVRQINDLCDGVRTGPPLLPTPKQIVEVVLLAAAAGILGA